MSWSGGCQCGSVRFRVDGELGRASICHCRMCQKAFGGFFGPYVSVRTAQVVWTRGAPRRFRSSNRISRGFCEACGTQLTFEWDAEGMDLTIGAFDRAAEIPPTAQLAPEAALPYVHGLDELPARAPQVGGSAEAFLASIVSHQHPDHDTEVWPPAEA